MSKEQLRFLISGILFGFLVGFLVAYGVYEPRVVQHATPAPAAGNLGMGGGAMGSGMPAPSGGGAMPDVSGSEPMMQAIFQEVAALKEAVEKNPRDARALVRLANVYHDAGKFEDAVAFYQRALEVDPRDVSARTDMGICLREIGKVDDAIAQFRTSLSYDRNHWLTWLNLGVVSLYDRNDVKTASEAFARVEALNPSFDRLQSLKDDLRRAQASPASR